MNLYWRISRQEDHKKVDDLDSRKTKNLVQIFRLEEGNSRAGSLTSYQITMSRFQVFFPTVNFNQVKFVNWLKLGAVENTIFVKIFAFVSQYIIHMNWKNILWNIIYSKSKDFLLC